MNKRKVGSEYEETAAGFLKKRGYEILQMNFRCHTGEIDIVAKDGECLVFVEVKYRKDPRMGWPSEAVNAQKQQQICKVALFYMSRFRIPDTTPVRFDVVGIMPGKIHLFRNAFEFRL